MDLKRIIVSKDKIVDKIRRENLKIAITLSGSHKQLAEKIGKSRSYITQLMSGKAITPSYCRLIEDAMGWEAGYMDVRHTSLTSDSDDLDEDLVLWNEKRKRLSREGKKHADHYVDMLLENESFKQSALDG